MTDAARPSGTTVRPGTSRWASSAVAALALVLLAACQPAAGPIPSAAGFFGDWVRNDRAGAAAISSPSIAAAMFSRSPYLAPALHFRQCTPGDAHQQPLCTWDDGLHQVQVSASPDSAAVYDAQWSDVYTGPPTGAIANDAWGTYLAWLHGDAGRARTYATQAAVTVLFAANRSTLANLDYVMCLPPGGAGSAQHCFFANGHRVLRLDYGTTPGSALVDHVVVTTAHPRLAAPTGIAISDATATTATVSWAPRAGAIGYVVTVTQLLDTYPGSQLLERTFVTSPSASAPIDSSTSNSFSVTIASVSASGVGPSSPSTLVH